MTTPSSWSSSSRSRTALRGSPSPRSCRSTCFEPGGWDDATKGKAVGSGPYRQTAHQPKSNTTFEAFADYNGPRKAPFKKMNWLSIVDAAPRVAKISGGSADAQIADNIPYANIDAAEEGRPDRRGRRRA